MSEQPQKGSNDNLYLFILLIVAMGCVTFLCAFGMKLGIFH